MYGQSRVCLSNDINTRSAFQSCTVPSRFGVSPHHPLLLPSACFGTDRMERTKKENALEERDTLRRQVAEDTRGIFSYFWPLHPIQLFVDLLWAIARLFSPLAPHLVPLAVFSVTLPLIILLSIGSGYFVWKSIAVSWETELFLQYGYVPFSYVHLCGLIRSQSCQKVMEGLRMRNLPCGMWYQTKHTISLSTLWFPRTRPISPSVTSWPA